MNLDFEIDNIRFNARAAAIIYNSDKTKVLLFNIPGRNYYMLPGGRIETFEDSKSAIHREIMEELGYDLKYNLCSIQENFLEKNDKKIMQYCFCYSAVYEGNIKNEPFLSKDNPNQYFSWLDIDEINNFKIVPESTYQLLGEEDIKHIIERV